jgi:uncharacterized protein (DUF952 family)
VPDAPSSHVTLHFCPLPVWEAQRTTAQYLPEDYQNDGFIHCTDDEERLITIGNMFYTGDPRAYVVLSVDLDANGERWIYEDPDQYFPHIYGPIHASAVVGVRPVIRAEDGAFLSFGEAS